LTHCHNTSLAALLTLPLSCLFPLEKQTKKKARKLHFGPGTAAAAMPVPLQISASWFLASSSLECWKRKVWEGGGQF